MPKKYNQYITLSDDCIGVVLTRGRIAKIDAVDLELVAPIKWYATPGRYTWYAKTNRSEGNAHLSHHAMHALIMETPEGFVTDHIDGDGLNNRRSNLRICTNTDNIRNSKAKVGRQYKGVIQYRRRWLATVTEKRKSIIIGRFDTPEEAALCYDAKAKELYGEFARLNFPDARLAPLRRKVGG